MDLIRDRKVDWKIYNYVCDYMEDKAALSVYQKELLKRIFVERDCPYDVYEYITSKKPKFIWRLTLLFYAITYVLLLIFCCFKWIFTGDFYLHEKDILWQFYKKWHNKIFLNNKI